MPRPFVWLFSKSYIAGEKLEDALRVSREINAAGAMVTIDILGEFITDLEEARGNKDEYIHLIHEAEKAGIEGNYSLKPTSFGLLIDREVCYTLIREIVSVAASYDNIIRVDMEDARCTDLEIDLFRRLKKDYPAHVGLVFQSYMKRTYSDMEGLMDLHTDDIPLNYRLCKGIYVESPEVAYKKYETINEHFLKDLEFMFRNGIYAGIATHDRPLVEGAWALIEKYRVPKEQYEFQMLYGVTPNLRKEIMDRGHRMRIYVPYGREWFGYSTRRLKENPKMASHIIKALFIKG